MAALSLTGNGPYYKPLANPTTGDEFLSRLALHQSAQKQSDGMYAAVAPLLGGTAPELNFVPTGVGAPTASAHTSANILPGSPLPLGTINVDPFAAAAFITPSTPYHDWAVNVMPHEFSHLHQTSNVVAQPQLGEGGAQAFADLVAQLAAQRAGIPYNPGPPGYYDANYAGYVQYVNQPPYGRDWILFGQFGRPVGVWP